MIDPFINTDDDYDRSDWTLSKKQFSTIISSFEPECRWLEDQD